MPVRKIPLRYSSLSGEMQSNKNKRSIGFESSLEADFITLMENDARVKGFEEQPFLIEFVDPAGKLRRYTPDFLVVFWEAKDKDTEKPIIYEIKYQKDLIRNKELYKDKFAAARQFCDELGYNFKILTEVEIRTQYLENIKFLSGYKVENVHWPKAERLLELIEKFEIIRIDALIASTSVIEETRAMYLYALWYLIYAGFVTCELSENITMSSNVWRTIR